MPSLVGSEMCIRDRYYHATSTPLFFAIRLVLLNILRTKHRRATPVFTAAACIYATRLGGSVPHSELQIQIVVVAQSNKPTRSGAYISRSQKKGVVRNKLNKTAKKWASRQGSSVCERLKNNGPRSDPPACAYPSTSLPFPAVRTRHLNTSIPVCNSSLSHQSIKGCVRVAGIL